MEQLDPISRWALTVNWQPWEVVGTVGAVIVAMVALTRAAREARERDAARLMAIAAIGGGIRDIIAKAAEGVTDPASAASEARFMRLMRPTDTALVALDSVDFTALPTRQAVDQYLVIRSQVDSVANYCDALEETGKLPTRFVEILQDSATRIDKAQLELSLLAAKRTRPLRYGVAKAQIWLRQRAERP